MCVRISIKVRVVRIHEVVELFEFRTIQNRAAAPVSESATENFYIPFMTSYESEMYKTRKPEISGAEVVTEILMDIHMSPSSDLVLVVSPQEPETLVLDPSEMIVDIHPLTLRDIVRLEPLRDHSLIPSRIGRRNIFPEISHPDPISVKVVLDRFDNLREVFFRRENVSRVDIPD